MPEVKLGLNDLNFGRSSAEDTNQISGGSLSSTQIKNTQPKNIINTQSISISNTIKTDNIDTIKTDKIDTIKTDNFDTQKIFKTDSMSKSPENTSNVNTSGNSDAVNLDDIKLHPCVDLAKFNAKGIITFVPPEGSFELVRYRLTRAKIMPPIFVEVQVDMNPNGKLT